MAKSLSMRFCTGEYDTSITIAGRTRTFDGPNGFTIVIPDRRDEEMVIQDYIEAPYNPEYGDYDQSPRGYGSHVVPTITKPLKPGYIRDDDIPLKEYYHGIPRWIRRLFCRWQLDEFLRSAVNKQADVYFRPEAFLNKYGHDILAYPQLIAVWWSGPVSFSVDMVTTLNGIFTDHMVYPKHAEREGMFQVLVTTGQSVVTDLWQ